MISVIGVIISLCLLGGAFLLIDKDSAKTYDVSSKFSCGYSNCDKCVTDDQCGFCSPKGQNKYGFCEPIAKKEGDIRSEQGFCSDTKSSNEFHTLSNGTVMEFADVYCHTQWTYVPIVLMVLYLCCFSSGYAPLPWVLNAEFYPLWARSTCISIATFTNWAFNLLISLTFLSLSQAATKAGKFRLVFSRGIRFAGKSGC